jgi:2-iminobutanoate/2-iminopropanoate deaminase
VAGRTVSTDRAPEAIGPYSQAVRSGSYVFCSGQVALDPSSGSLVEGSVGEQTRRAMENVRAVLEAAGTGFDSVVKVTAYLIDMADFEEFNEVYGSYFSDSPPARATVGVASLPKGARVEVECVAEI